MNHASGTVAPLDPELIQVGDAIWQRAQRAAWFRISYGRWVLQESSYSRSTIVRCR